MIFSDLTSAGKSAALGFTLLLSASTAPAQIPSGSTPPSTQDTQFLQDIGKDSNFEIKTSQLALQKSSSADVKQYATMVIQDHTKLKKQITSADHVAKLSPTPADEMSSSDQNTYDTLKGLSGDAFDQSYIKQLVKGNDQIQKEEKAETSGSQLPAVKDLAARSAALDTKHAAKAKQLAKAHNVQT